MLRRPARAVLALLLLVALTLLAGCGGDDADAGGGGAAADGPAVAWVDPDGEIPYIGALDVNPRDGSLLLSSNTGLFRIAEGGRPERIQGTLRTPEGEGAVSEELVIRFTGPDALMGSGHPPEGSSLPEFLGFMRSEDAGRTWQSVSMLGDGDFHVLRESGEVVVAALFDVAEIAVSRDGGRTFPERRQPPLPVVDLAVDPGDARRWVATTERGVFVSSDEGESWRQRDDVPNSHLAWPEPGTLYRADPDGPLQVSTDGGATWERRGDVGSEPQALAAHDGTLHVALLDGTISRSADEGRTWEPVVRPG